MSHLQDAAIQAAETIQTAHINKAPGRQDMAPSTAADTHQPVVFDSTADMISDADYVGEDEVPLSILRPLPREEDRPRPRPPHMQLPDLRFEQSYLKSISQAKDWKMVTYITIKDQVMMPLVQGVAWTLIVAWWKHWNTATKFSGQTVGAKIRRWYLLSVEDSLTRVDKDQVFGEGGVLPRTLSKEDATCPKEFE